MADAAGGLKIAFVRHNAIRRFWWIFRRSCAAAYRDNAFGIAKGAAYSALLSFFPVLTTVTAILVQANAYRVSRNLAALVFQVVPPGTEEIVMWNFTERGARPVSLLIGAAMLSVWAASGVMLSLMEGFRAAYKIPQGRPFLKQRGVAALLVFSAALPVVAASALIVFGGRIEDWVLTRIGVLDEGEQLIGWFSLLTQLVRFAVAFGAIVTGTCVLYHLGPNPPRPVRTVWHGAILAAILWLLTTTGFAWYVRNIANYNVLYGSVGAVIALLVWMYLLSVIALIGCEFNAQRDKLRSQTLRAVPFNRS
jgi:membrane protein